MLHVQITDFLLHGSEDGGTSGSESRAPFTDTEHAAISMASSPVLSVFERAKELLQAHEDVLCAQQA